MTAKEVVRRAIEFREPPRVPLKYCNRDLDRSDVRGCGWGPAAGWEPEQPGATEWGYVWSSLDQTMGQTQAAPLADPAALEGYVPPDPYAPGRFEGLSSCVAEGADRFLTFGVGISGFNQATFLRGMEDLLCDLALAPERAGRVLDLVFDWENALLEQACAYPVDCIGFADDWGTQRGLMISPAKWREVFAPRYAEQFARAHAAGKKVWFHTCGNVWEIIGDLIEVGVDVLELLQPDIFGVERLGREFGGQVCFCCAVDHQRVAVSGGRAEIFAYVRRLCDCLGGSRGGFIGYIEDYASLGMSEENYQWLGEAFHSLPAREETADDL
ncbi:MAG TPA: uroporphyrinogen decarboxylase family protein [Armatimonadota bacterium]|jgi:hypothetical protein